jgi:ATP-binding cassette, subfamily G (WHITE), member 2, SNQ2
VLTLASARATVVGDSLLRGISGGEKKRLTIGEMLAAQGGVLLADGHSRVSSAAYACDVALL